MRLLLLLLLLLLKLIRTPIARISLINAVLLTKISMATKRESAACLPAAAAAGR